MNGEQRNVTFRYQSEQGDIQKYFSDGTLFAGHELQIIGKLGVWDSKSFRANFDKRPVTIKVVDEPKLSLNEQEIRQHIEALKRLNYPRIGRVLDCIRDPKNNRSYVIMEFVNGTGLDRAIEEKFDHVFPQGLVLNWGYQMLEALNYLHQNYICGNLKLSNIVRRRDNSICLCDFSSLVDEPGGDLPLENNPDEMDYAQSSGFFSIQKDPKDFQRDVQEDIYRLGDIMFQLLTGEKARKGEKDSEKKARLKGKGITFSVADVIAKALSENPEDRWQSADEMKNALLALPLRDFRRRKHMKSVILHFSLIFIAAVVGFGLFRAGRAMERRTQEMERLTAEAQTAWRAGDYTAAYGSLFQSLQKRFPDPGCSAETLRTAAEILGAYDYNSGFRPAYSVGQSGEPLFCAVTPGGTRLAVLTEETLGLSASARFLHVLDAQSGAECAKAVEVSVEAVPRVEFLDENTILYVNRDGALALRRLDGEEDLDATSTNVRRFALSGDRTVAAFLRGDSAKELIAYVTLMTENSHFSPEKNVALEKETYDFFSYETKRNETEAGKADLNQMELAGCLFALNQDGSRLAVSLVERQSVGAEAKGLLRVYSFPEPGEPDGAVWKNLPLDHPYARYEGGFCGDYLAFAAWTERESDCLSRISVYDLNSDSEDPLLTRPLFEQVHASVDENGIYVSQKGSLARISANPLLWDSFSAVEGGVNALRHTAKYALVVTDDGETYICNTDGDGQQRVFTGSVSCAALSDQYLLFCDRSKISVQEWKDGAQNALSRIEYDAGYPHLLFNVTESRLSAVLYGGPDLFRVYGADGALIRDGATDAGARNLKYLREPEREAEPKEECLRVEYPNRTVYYAAADGAFLDEQAPLADNVGVLTEDYRLAYHADGYVEIYSRDSGAALKRISAGGRLADAFQALGKNYLLISLLSEENEPSALLLNRDLEVIANLSGAFTVLPDGALYYDDRAGVLLEGVIYDRDALAETAERAYAPNERVDSP